MATRKIVPRADNEGGIGTTSKKWASLWATLVNGLTLTKETVGFTISGGTTSKTLTVSETTTLNGGTHSGTNTGDQTLPVKATGAELDTGTDDVKFATAKALLDSKYINESQLQNGGLIYAADAGSTDAYAITLSPAPSAYANGQIFAFKANTINTGACTLNVNSLGAKTIKKQYNVDLADGDIKANQLVSVIYDGTNFQMLSPVSNAASGTMGIVVARSSNFTTASTSFVDITGFTHALSANKKYRFSITGVIGNEGGTSTAIMQAVIPTGAYLSTISWMSGDVSNNTTISQLRSTSPIILAQCAPSNSSLYLDIEGLIEVGSTAGNMVLQTRTTNSNYSSVIYAGTHFIIEELS